MKEQYHCLEIKFNTKWSDDEFYHAHLYLNPEKIELRVYFDSSTRLAFKFMSWLSYNDDYEKINSYTEFKIYEKEEELTGLNFSNSKLIGATSEQTDNHGDYFTIILDQITVSKPIEDDYTNSAKIFLNNQGFELVKNYYSVLFGLGDGNFEIKRMRGMDSFYKLGHSKFRPEFEFPSSDKRDNNEPKIKKVPIIKYQLRDNLTEEEVINYINISCKITSFYHRVKIDFNFAIINLKEKKILVYKTLGKEYVQKTYSLTSFLNVKHRLDGFLKLDWSENYLANQSKLDKAIDSFVQARLLDENSKFLLLYNTLEICMKGYSYKSEQFNLVVNSKVKDEIYNDALEILKKTINSDEYVDFKIKWETVKKKLSFKPMKSHLEDFIKENKIPINEFKIPLSRLKEIRDKLMHGSTNSIKHDEISAANTQLFKIDVILIFNILGIKEWEFNA